MSDYFEMREALFKQRMKKAFWICYPRGFSPFTRDVPSYTLVCSLDSPEGIMVESRMIAATHWERANDKRAFLSLLVAELEHHMRLAWHAS